MINTNIACNIKKYRTTAKLKQFDIAKACSVDRATVSKWEAGEFLPRADKLPALAQILKCNVSDLLTEPVEVEI